MKIAKCSRKLLARNDGGSLQAPKHPLPQWGRGEKARELRPAPANPPARARPARLAFTLFPGVTIIPLKRRLSWHENFGPQKRCWRLEAAEMELGRPPGDGGGIGRLGP